MYTSEIIELLTVRIISVTETHSPSFSLSLNRSQILRLYHLLENNTLSSDSSVTIKQQRHCDRKFKEQCDRKYKNK